MSKLGKILWIFCISTSTLLVGCFVFMLLAIPSSRILEIILAVIAFTAYAFLIWCLKGEFNKDKMKQKEAKDE